MAELTVAVVSAERRIWSGAATRVVAKTPDGEIGIMPGHEPVLALLMDSPVRIDTTDGTKVVVAAHGGFFSVDSNNVSIISEVAELAQDIDLDRAKAALDRAKGSPDDPDEYAALKRAETRIQAAGIAKGVG